MGGGKYGVQNDDCCMTRMCKKTLCDHNWLLRFLNPAPENWRSEKLGLVRELKIWLNIIFGC